MDKFLRTVFFHLLNMVKRFPLLRDFLAPYREAVFKFMYSEGGKDFFNDFKAGKYLNSHVALIQAPGWGVNTPPCSIASLSAYLRKYNCRVMPIDINVEMFNRNKKRYPEGWKIDVSNFWNNPSRVQEFINSNKADLDKFADAVVKSGAKIAGFTIYDSSYRVSCYLAKEIKARCKDILIVFGGPHASDYMAGKTILLNNPEADIVVEGEGEETLLEITRKVLSGSKIIECAGARYRVDGKVVKGSKRELIKSLDSLPFPDYSDFKFSLYTEPFKTPISSSRGCINRCIYCNEKPFWERYRFRSGEVMFEEVKHQIKRHPWVFFLDFQDSLCNGNIKALGKFCDLIIAEGLQIQWAGQAIIRKEMDYELFVKIKKSGCVNLSFGLETASPRLFENIGKVMARGVDIDRFVADSKRAGVECGLNFMFGLPGETDADAEESINFVRRNATNISSVNPSPSFCGVCPGTLANETPEKYGIDLTQGPTYWESMDGTNNYLKRIERFEKFIAAVHELNIPCVYASPRLANKNELIANYYYAICEFEKAIHYYEGSLRSESDNQTTRDRLEFCRKKAKERNVG